MTDMVNLDLSTIGDLNAECVALIPSLIKSLYDDKCKSKLSITIEFQRLTDSESAVVVGYALKPAYPKRAQQMLCRTDLTGNLRTELPEGRQLSILHLIEEEER